MSFPTGVVSGFEGQQYQTFDRAENLADDAIRAPLGSGIEMTDGRLFRFALMGGVAGVASNLYQSEVPTSDFDTLAVQAAAAVGANAISFTNGSTAIASQDFIDGYCIVETATALGALYKIFAHTNPSGAATGTLTLHPNATVQTALATSDKITLVKNPYHKVIIQPSPGTAKIMGVPAAAIPADDFGWLQTRGIASCLVNGTHVIGEPLVPSNAVDGATAMKRVRGTATITTTSAVITHNSGNTPILGDINVEYGEDPTTAPETRWIDTFTATQFTINVETDPSTNDLDLAWVLEVPADPVGVCVEVAPTTDFGLVSLHIE